MRSDKKIRGKSRDYRRGRATKTERLLAVLLKSLPAYPVGSRFVSDRDVCRRYMVSPPVARTVLAEMTKRGLIRRVTGRGTYIESHAGIVQRDNPFRIAVFSALGNWFPHAVAVGTIERYLRQHRYDLTVYDNDHAKSPDINRIAMMIDGAFSRVDGVIWISAFSGEQAETPALIRRRANKIVFVNLRFTDRGATSVMRDDRAGMFALAEHLIRLGHRRLSYIGGPAERLISRERYSGFCDALKAHGLATNPSWQLPFQPDISYEIGYRMMDKLLNLPERPTACLCIADNVAQGALAKLKENGVRVPEDMALTGFDNSENPLLPSFLTTADLAFDEIGGLAAMHLVNQLHGRTRPGALVFMPCPLVVRSSTSPARNAEATAAALPGK
jgi:DNA-binding LacI/PurR family transcriptional regulator/ribosomal protein S25